MKKRLSHYKRIVIKIGSSLLIEPSNGALKRQWLESLADDIKRLSADCELLIVSSGSIALGRNVLKLPTQALKLEESQAAAAVGQIALAQAYTEILAKRGLIAGQILLTLDDTENRRNYLNARSTIATLLRLKALPIINENDTVATHEIRYGDNDCLAARVATMISADCLILLSDVDGLYSAPPNQDKTAYFIPEVANITPEIEAMAGAAGSELSRGGMKTKIDAGRIATAAGSDMVIASGREYYPLTHIEEVGRATWFAAHETPTKARKRWIAGHLKTCGALLIDDGAVIALDHGKSLLPAGVIGIHGSFSRGDTIAILDAKQHEIGRGLVAYDSTDATLLAGCNSHEIASILGYEGRAEMIHRDDMALRRR